MTVNTQKPIVIFRGDNTAAFDLRTIKILLTGDLDLTNATARFDLLDFTKSWTTEEVATGELSIVFDSAQTKSFALGPQTGTLRLYDMSTGTPRQLTIVNKIPFFVTNRVCEIDSQSYEADVCVSGGDVIHIEFKVGAGAVEGKADKVKNATAGDLASLTADGNLEDSGIPKTNVLRKSQMDSTPTAGSQNPVTSDGIKQAIDAATPSDYAQVKAQVQQNATDITAINGKIPAQASAQNQLADKAFVNSSIATNTATFRGSYNLVSDLGLTVSATEQQVAAAIATKLASLVPPVVPENNDYCFVQVPKTDADPTVIERVDRYKCTVSESGGVTTSVWEYEWSLNNSSFTADQWAAINSGITSGLVEKLNGIEAGAQVNTVTSVNSKTGAVVLSASDVGALGNTGNQTLDGTLAFEDLTGTQPIRSLGYTNDGFVFKDHLGDVIEVPKFTTGTLALLSQIYAAVQQIAPAWVSGTTYDATARVSYNGVVYARKTSGFITSSTNPASDTTNWEAKKVSELFLPLTGGTMSGELKGKNITVFDTAGGFLTLHADSTGTFFFYRDGWYGASSPIYQIYLPDATGTVALLQSLAPDFSTSATYAVGQLCVYSTKLYRCTTAIETAEKWTAAHWTEATVEDVLAIIRSALDNKAPLASPAFTGTPTAPNLTDQSADGQVANKKYVDDKVAGVSVTPLSGQTFDFATMQGIFAGVKACIEALGGSVTNFPAIPANE